MNLSDFIGEATAYDKKLMLERKEPLSWLKSVSAFANTDGGTLIFGVSDDGDLIGLENVKMDAEDLSETIKCAMDPDAVEECLVNGLIHRDYLEIGSELHIDIFDDRLEIYSPGGMPSGEFIQNLDMDAIPSTRRNPVIADLFQRLDLMERRGSGFGKILNAYRFEAEKRGIFVKPVFRSTVAGFFVTLPNLNKDFSVVVDSGKTTTETTTETAADKVVLHDDKTVVERVGKRAAKIFRMIESDNCVTAAEIAARMQITVDGVRYNLNKSKWVDSLCW